MSPASSSSSGRGTSTERIEALTGKKSYKRQAEEDQFGGSPGKALERDLKRRASAQDRDAREQYESGRDDARAEQRTKAKAKAGSKARTKARRSARKVTTAAKSPVKATRSGSVIGLLVGSLGLVLLFNFLRSADKAAGFIDGIRTAIAWIADPAKVIDYKGGG
jgi:alanyl-tRNA synthetase